MTGRFLRQNRIGLLSHGSVLGRRSPVPALCWIPDFQHVHRPEFFSAEEIAMRDRYFADGAADAQGILLSSADAAADFARLFPRHAHKARILRFVADSHPATAEEQQAVLGKYDIHEPFFHVPNQLWIHKNHGVVLEALKTLKSRGKVPLVISTGRTNDYRHPEYFPAFKKEVEEAGLAERFRFLGLAPYEDVRALMTAAVAFVNPSFFEGWSTTVEEAKSLGKKILLSGIGVHKEQAPERGVFFDPEDGAALADAMAECLAAYDPQAEMRAREAAQAALPGRMRAFGREYEKIVLDMASGKEKP
ncbi:MAG: glycosyltransferase family 4 protein [Desulfovibrio sp.]|nr:glycosyltransferase family 4 protein [Desulfovibrio sp.]